MVQAIVSAVLLVLLAVLVAFNVRFTTSFSLFGARFEEVPTMALALVSFALGVVYSLFLCVSRFLQRQRRKGLEKKDKALAQRERVLAARESVVDAASDASAGIDESSQSGGKDREPQNAPEPKRARFFDWFKTKR